MMFAIIVFCDMIRSWTTANGWLAPSRRSESFRVASARKPTTMIAMSLATSAFCVCVEGPKGLVSVATNGTVASQVVLPNWTT
jgi:hypothetical protein